MTPIFHDTDAPFTLPEIAHFIKCDYNAVRGVVRRLRLKPETSAKVTPLGDSRPHEYSAEAANFIARRCANNRRAKDAQ